MNFNLRLLASTMSLAFAATAFAADEPKKDAAPEPTYTLTGHVDLVSAYYLRGITNTYGNIKQTAGPQVANRAGDAPESRDPAFQWGADFAHASGWYVGYWGSQLTYSYDAVGKSYDYYKNGTLAAVTAAKPGFYVTDNSIENDLYGGYTGKVGELGYNLGATYYIYAPGKYSNALETKVALTYGEFGASAQTLLDDTIWGNKGDTYWTATWTKALPYDFTFTANLGAYTYTKEGKFLGSRDTAFNVACAANNYFFVNGCYASTDSSAKPISAGFRHLILGISQPIGSTGLTWNAQAIIGGVNRFNIQQENKITAGIAFAF